jgi:hypothetical protein
VINPERVDYLVHCLEDFFCFHEFNYFLSAALRRSKEAGKELGPGFFQESNKITVHNQRYILGVIIVS